VFETAPPWFRPVLHAEMLVLRRLRDRLPTQAHLHGDDEAVADYAVSPIGIRCSERLVMGANASAYVPEHVSRYVWALNEARGQRVVDLGCGDGYGTLMLSWSAQQAIGVDRSETAVQHARETYPRGPEYRIADLTVPEQIPDADVGVCFEVLEHLDDPDTFLRAIGSRLPRLLVSFPNPLVGGSHINAHHVNDWPLRTLKEHLRAAGARELKLHHQGVRHHQIGRGAAPWHGTWLVDARF
jgi:SAM-dependent methyltransferase